MPSENTQALPDITNLIYSETGLVGLLLILAVFWLVLQLSKEKEAHSKTNDKLYTLGMASVEQSTKVNENLEKIYQFVSKINN